MTGRAADPTREVREGTYVRDGRRCVSCGRRDQLSYQHRQSVGMGGSKRRPGYADGVTACMDCNPRFEHDLQRQALRNGWKVPRWVANPGHVPVLDRAAGRWYRLDDDGGRREIDGGAALQAMFRQYGDTYRLWSAVAPDEPPGRPSVAPAPWKVS